MLSFLSVGSCVGSAVVGSTPRLAINIQALGVSWIEILWFHSERPEADWIDLFEFFGCCPVSSSRHRPLLWHGVLRGCWEPPFCVARRWMRSSQCPTSVLTAVLILWLRCSLKCFRNHIPAIALRGTSSFRRGWHQDGWSMVQFHTRVLVIFLEVLHPSYRSSRHLEFQAWVAPRRLEYDPISHPLAGDLCGSCRRISL